MPETKILEFIEQIKIPYLPRVYTTFTNKDGIIKKEVKEDHNDYTIEEIEQEIIKMKNRKKEYYFCNFYDFNSHKFDVEVVRNNILNSDYKGNNFSKIIKKEPENPIYPIYSLYIKYSEFIVIDVDEKDIDHIDKFGFFKDCPWKKGNTKGIHIFIKIKNLPQWINVGTKIWKDKKYEVDVIAGVGNNLWVNPEAIIYNFRTSGDYPLYDWNDIKTYLDLNNDESGWRIGRKKISNNVINNIKKIKVNKTNIIVNEININPDTQIEEEINNDDVNKKVFGIIENDAKNENKIYTKEEIKSLIDKINPELAGPYETWCSVVYAIYNTWSEYNNKNIKFTIGDRNELIHYWSQKAGDGYDEENVNKYIENNVKERAQNNTKNTMGTIIYLAKENEELNEKNEEKNKENNNIIDNINLEYEVEEAKDDLSAAQIILKRLNNRVFIYKNRLFLKHNFIWYYDINFIKYYLMNMIYKSNIKKRDEKNQLQDFTTNTPRANSIFKCLEVLLFDIKNINDDIYEKFHTTTKNKLCFLDGVLDFKTKTFTLWEDLPENSIYTTIRINRNYHDYFNAPNRAIIEDIKKSLFEPLYGEKMEKALQFLSRGITGNNDDKTWGSYLGNRNCGKGVEYDLLKNGFGQYVTGFELSNLLTSKITNGSECLDASKKLYWLIDLEFVRLAISQEIPTTNSGLAINSKILKKLSGGGDEIIARRNFDRFDLHFLIDTTFYIKGNSSLLADNNDVFETCLEFESTVQFKTKEQIDYLNQIGEDTQFYRVSDPNIKDKMKTVEYSNAIVYLLMENWKSSKVEIMRDSSNDESIVSLINQLKETYDITGNNNDIVLCNEIFNTFTDKKKITLELSNVNVHKKKYKGGDILFRDKMCFFGIKLKQNIQNPIVLNI